MKILRERKWTDVLGDRRLFEGKWYYIYGDSAYFLRFWMQKPFRGEMCAPSEEEGSATMSMARVCVTQKTLNS